MAEHDRNLRVLIVDDEECLRETIGFEFEGLGYEVFTAPNGAQALAACQESRPNLIISDIRMPGGDGIELLENLKSSDPFSPLFIFISGYADIDWAEAYELGADGILDKPFDHKELINTSLRALQSPKERWQSHDEPPSPDETVVLRQMDFEDWQQGMSFGRGGFAVLHDEMVMTHDKIYFYIDLQNGPVDHLEGRGTVRWARPHKEKLWEIGVEFHSLNEEAIDWVINYVQSNSVRAYIPTFPPERQRRGQRYRSK